MSVTRRAVLAGIAAGVLAGCRPRRPGGPSVPSGDRRALDEALQGERVLLARYDEAIAKLDAAAAGPLSRARDRHTAHLHALTAARSPTPSPPSPSGSPSATVGREMPLSSLLGASSLSLRQAAIRVRTGRLAALLASIAAEHAADSGHDFGTR